MARPSNQQIAERQEAQQVRETQDHNGSTGSETVTVASKLPMDFVLQLHDKVTRHEPVIGGGMREFAVYQQRFGAPTYIINGNSWAQNKGPHQQIQSGFAITHGIPKAFWEEWLDQQGNSDIVRNGMIFAHSDLASVTAHAKENENEKSGLERLDPADMKKFGLEKSDLRRAS